MSIELLEFTAKIEESIKDFETILEDTKNKKVPITSDYYNIVFDKLPRLDELFQQYDQQLQQINDLMKQHRDIIDNFRKELNNQKLKFGLQGQLKQQIRSQQDVTSLPPHVQDIVNNPIVPTPFENRGRKKRRKTRKNRRTRK